MSRHTQTEISMLTKLNLSHGVADNTVYSSTFKGWFGYVILILSWILHSPVSSEQNSLGTIFYKLLLFDLNLVHHWEEIKHHAHTAHGSGISRGAVRTGGRQLVRNEGWRKEGGKEQVILISAFPVALIAAIHSFCRNSRKSIQSLRRRRRRQTVAPQSLRMVDSNVGETHK